MKTRKKSASITQARQFFTKVKKVIRLTLAPNIFQLIAKLGWSCCKPRVLTFDEFLSIPPCTTGRHSTVDDIPPPAPKQSLESIENLNASSKSESTVKDIKVHQAPIPQAPQAAKGPNAALQSEESDSDDPDQAVPPNANCKRRGCNATSAKDAKAFRKGEECLHHPGRPIFHEGSKGWTCCKRRVLEFDEFMKIEGCTTRTKHLFTGRKKNTEQEEKVSDVRHDYYQTPTTVIASLFLKKIDKGRARVDFTSPRTVSLDLHTSDNKSYSVDIPLFGPINTAASAYKIMGTKLELTLAKADGSSWPTLRSDEQRPNEIRQVGQAARS